MNLLLEALVHQAFIAQKDHLFHDHVMEASFVQMHFSLLLKENAVLATIALERQRLVSQVMISQEIFVHKDTFVLKVVLPRYLVLLEHTAMHWATRMYPSVFNVLQDCFVLDMPQYCLLECVKVVIIAQGVKFLLLPLNIFAHLGFSVRWEMPHQGCAYQERIKMNWGNQLAKFVSLVTFATVLLSL
jgi:hypothetical protein